MTTRSARSSAADGRRGRTGRRREAPVNLQVNLRSQQPIYEQVKATIKQQIGSGVLKPGDRLPTLRQLSQELHIAYATVGRAIRDLVEEGTLEAKTARGTRVAMRRMASRGAVGLVGSYPFRMMLHETHYYKALLYQLQENFIEHGQAIVYDHWPLERPLTAMFNELQLVDGIVLLGVEPRQYPQIDEVRRLGVPSIIVSQAHPHESIPSVDSNNEQDARRAVQSLHRMGHKYVALVQLVEPPHASTNHARAAGYRMAMDEAGLPPARDWFVVDAPESWASRLLALRPAPTAILLDGISGFDVLYQALAGTPLEPGKGLLVCAYDELLWDQIGPLGIEHVRIDQPLDRIAATTVSMMLKMLRDPSYQARTTLLPSTIVRVLRDGSATRLS